jgi:hypothetical protein
MIITYPTYMQSQFETALEKVNKKLSKIEGTTPVTVEEVTYSNVTIGVDSFGADMKMDIAEVLVTAPISTKHKGFEFKGSVSYIDGVKMIVGNGDHNLTHIEEMRCDHCNHKRKRNTVYAFTNPEGEEVIIGSTCVDEYMGININKALSVFNGFVTETYGDEDEFRIRGGSIGSSMDELIHATLKVYATDSIYKKFETVTEVLICLSNARESKDSAVSIRNVAMGVMTVAKVKELMVKQYGSLDANSSNFASNLVNSLFLPNTKNFREYLPKSLRGIVVYGIYSALNSFKEEENKKQNPVKMANEHIGSEGDKIEMLGNVILVKSIPNDYGVSFLFVINTEEGQLKTFTTSKTFDDVSEGDKITIKGTIKRHEEFKGIKSTLLTRVKKV